MEGMASVELGCWFANCDESWLVILPLISLPKLIYHHFQNSAVNMVIMMSVAGVIVITVNVRLNMFLCHQDTD